MEGYWRLLIWLLELGGWRSRKGAAAIKKNKTGCAVAASGRRRPLSLAVVRRSRKNARRKK